MKIPYYWTEFGNVIVNEYFSEGKQFSIKTVKMRKPNKEEMASYKKRHEYHKNMT